MLNIEIKKSYQEASRTLLEKKNRLIAEFLEGTAPGFLERHTRLLDEYFCDSFEKSLVGPTLQINRNPYAVIALGGYGRGEQCVHSDVDVLFLFKKKIPNEAEALIREMIYPLWDIGMDIGHATRSLSECIGLAGKDPEVLTSLLDARFICGMSPLYSEMMERLREKILFRRGNKITTWLVDANRERHRIFGDSAYLLEPNLKEGQGGLRDYHTILWISRIKHNLRRPRDLEYNGFLSHDEFQSLTQALTFIWNVRSCLHHLVGRKYDQLHFEHQTRLAGLMGYRKDNGQSAVERFLGDLHGWMELVKQRHLVFLYEMGGARKWFDIKKRSTKQTKVQGLEVKKDRLRFLSPEEMLSTPDLILRIFEESARLKIPLDVEAKRLIREFPYLVDDRFRSSRRISRIFERILATPAPTFNVLNEMLVTGFLERYIPEFAGIINRIEYDAYHVYPVDKHSLRTVRTLKSFGEGDDPDDRLYAQLFREIPNRRPLLWAALLHDIGKGVPGGDHADKGAERVRTILARAGVRPADAETAAWLVAEHLFLIKTATRRDINEEETAIFCARRIQDIERLKMLYLLTVADFMSTGPKAWNEWTGILLRDLFFKVLHILENGELASHEAMEILREKERRLIDAAEAEPVRARRRELLRVMSPRYLLYTPAGEIEAHMALFESLGEERFVWKVDRSDQTRTRTLTICGRDMPGLFSKIAGVLTLGGVDVLEAQIHTWRNNITLNVFRVTPPPDQLFEEERWERARRDLRGALDGDLDLQAALAEKREAKNGSRSVGAGRPNRVVVDNQTSSFFTIIEVFTYDDKGVLHRITDALFRNGLDIWSAQIATKVEQVVDVFYVRDFDGQKIDAEDQVSRIKRAVLDVLPAVPPGA